MGKDSKIEWTSHTFNPWIGCAKVSPGCTNCYAEQETPARVSRTRGLELWGPKAHRQVTGADYWSKPIAWQKAAKAAGERHRVFCASMADVFEAPMDPEQAVKIRSRRAMLWKLIKATQDLDWLILTKRPENIVGMLPEDWGNGYPNVWLGVSVEDQERADERILVLLRVPAVVRFVSAEPLLGPTNLRRYMWPVCASFPSSFGTQEAAEAAGAVTYRRQSLVSAYAVFIDWVIVGGESGPGARPCAVEWIEDIVEQCDRAGAACFVKQLGAKAYLQSEGERCDGKPHEWAYLELEHSKGGNIEEFPEQLRVRQFPAGLKDPAAVV